MANYTPELALDKNTHAYQNAPPPTSVVARYGSENASTSSVITLTHDTSLIEIAAVGGPAVMRWVRTADTQASIVSAASGANFTHVIGTGTVRQFTVPKESAGTSSASVQGVNRGEGLFQRVAYKSIGVASVLLSEFTPGGY